MNEIHSCGFTIYCAHPISGCSYDDVIAYYQKVVKELGALGYRVLTPMCGKDYLRNDPELKASGYGQPVSTNHAIKERDKWMVKTADIVFVNLVGATQVSIGSCMELAWGDDNNRHTIVALEESNIHRHAFVLDAADIVFPAEQDALDYLALLATCRVPGVWKPE